MADSPVMEPFEVLSWEQLRARTSIKWRMFEPDVLPLWVAEMDAPPVPSVVEAVTAAVRTGDLGYPPPDDTYAVALADVAAARWGWRLEAASTSLVADVLTGVREALDVVTAPGDAILLPAPVYHPLVDIPAAMGRRLVTCTLTTEGRLDLAAIEVGLADPMVRALLLCSPHNPTGVVHTRAELEAVAALAADRGVAVVVDEIHALVVPGGGRFTPYLSVTDSGIVVTSASKAYNMAGIKAALIAVGAADVHLLERLPATLRWGASKIGLVAHVAAWSGGDAWLDAVNANIAANAAFLGELLAERMPAVRYAPPRATYLAWLDCRTLGLGDDPAEAFRERGRVALNSGTEFGPGGEGFVRVNIAASRATLTEAVERMASVRD